MFAEIAENQGDYKNFYQQLSKNLKREIHEGNLEQKKDATGLELADSTSKKP